MIKDIRIPEISENVTSGNVVEVLVKPGDEVKVDDTLIEFETDKAVVEIPSPFDGRITEVLAKEGDEMNVGDVIAKIDTAKEAAGEDKEEERAEARKGEGGNRKAETEEKAPPQVEATQKTPERKPEAEEEEEEEESEKSDKAEPERSAEESEEEEKKAREAEADEKRSQAEAQKSAPASPSVRRFARELGIDIHDVKPAGPGDRITETDVKAYAKRELSARGESAAAAPALDSAKMPALPDFSRWGEVETRELTNVRRLTAGSMTVSWQTVVHVTQFERVDITAALDFMNRNADKAADQGGKLTITAVL
ncbi:MAG: biotin/lipoyl-containing protein, partial [Desulfobacterales bacterium]